MDNNNPDPQPSTSAQAKKSNQDQEAKSSKKPKNDDSNANVESISPALAVAAPGSSTGNKLSLIYGLDYIVKQFGKYGAKEELKMLRSLSNNYYEKLNPIYWDKAGFPIWMKIGVFDENGAQDVKILNMNGENWRYVTYFENLSQHNWAREIMKIAHTFRALSIITSGHQPQGDKTLFSLPLDLIRLISPHIKYLEIDHYLFEVVIGKRRSTPVTSQELVEFIEQFNNLKSCKITYENSFWDHLEMILRRFSPSIQIEILLDNIFHVPDLFNHLGDIILNVRWIRYAYTLELGTIYAPLFRQWPNLDFNFDISTQEISNLDDLRSTSQICLDYKINTLALNLNLTAVPDQDEDAVKTCLGVLRSYVTRLRLHFETKNWNIDIGDETWSWPKITELELRVRFDTTGGNIPFVIIKNSPNLENLYLHGTGGGDPRSILIFQNPENIREFFGGLTKLKILQVTGVLRQNQESFQAYLKQRLPGIWIYVMS